VAQVMMSPAVFVTQVDISHVVLPLKIRYHLVENMRGSMSINISKTMKVGVAAIVLAAIPLAAQAPAYRAPRAPGGKPDLNGIWQTMNEANYDLEGHSARAAMQLRPGPMGPVPAPSVLALGAVGAVPPSLGVVEGGEIPYKPEALAKKKENQANWISRDPEIKCYLPGVPRATYMGQPFRIFQNATQLFIAYQWGGAVRNIYLTDPGPAPSIHGWDNPWRVGRAKPW
jgi:hypothetical protein